MSEHRTMFRPFTPDSDLDLGCSNQNPVCDTYSHYALFLCEVSSNLLLTEKSGRLFCHCYSHVYPFTRAVWNRDPLTQQARNFTIRSGPFIILCSCNSCGGLTRCVQKAGLFSFHSLFRTPLEYAPFKQAVTREQSRVQQL